LQLGDIELGVGEDEITGILEGLDIDVVLIEEEVERLVVAQLIGVVVDLGGDGNYRVVEGRIELKKAPHADNENEDEDNDDGSQVAMGKDAPVLAQPLVQHLIIGVFNWTKGSQLIDRP
jgi:hypothetical protein